MNRKFSTILTLLLLLVLSTSTVGAAGAIKLSGSPTASSPLHLDGTLTGLGGYSEFVTLTLTGFAIPTTICTNQGGNEAPGQNPPKVTASGEDTSLGDEPTTKNGKDIVNVTVEDLVGTTLSGTQGGCPNDNWSAVITSLAWTYAIVEVTDNANSNLLLHNEYSCAPKVNNPTAYSCTLIPELSYTNH